MRAVNLLPRDEQRVPLQGTRTPLLVVAGGIAAVTAAAGVLAFSASGAAADREAELQAIEASIARLPRTPDPAVSQGALTQERTDRIVAMSAALSSRVAFDRLLRDVSLVFPEDAWLTGIKALSPSGLTPAPGSPGSTPAPVSPALQGVTIQGATYSHASVARILSRLSVVPSLENLTLTASALVEPVAVETQTPGEQGAKPEDGKKAKKGKAVVTFTISASVRLGGSS